MLKTLRYLLLVVSIASQSCCKTDCDNKSDGDNQPTPYNLIVPSPLPPLAEPPDNPLTIEGVALGRKLFYEPLLSADGTQSCSSCHNQFKGFTDPSQFSTGIDGVQGDRNAMVLFNLAWSPSLFWDGRANSLEEQALEPINNPIEMPIRNI